MEKPHDIKHALVHQQTALEGQVHSFSVLLCLISMITFDKADLIATRILLNLKGLPLRLHNQRKLII